MDVVVIILVIVHVKKNTRCEMQPGRWTDEEAATRSGTVELPQGVRR